MTLMRFDPFRELDHLGGRMLGAGAVRAIPAEAFRRGDEFYVLIDVPGVVSSDLNVTVERNVVSVQVTRRSPRQDGDDLIIDERPHGEMSRQFFLGDNLDAARLNAELENGVLTMRIPVSEQSKPRQVEIASSSTRSEVAASDNQPARA